MSVLQFIAAVVSAIAWPVAALGMALALRGTLAGLVSPSAAPNSREKSDDLDFDFQGELYEISEISEISGASGASEASEAAAAHAQPPAAHIGSQLDAADGVGTLLAEVDAVAAISPLAAIPLTWTVVESEIGKSLERLGIPVRSLRQPAQHIRTLAREGYIGSETATVLNRLRQLRNKAAHAAHTRIHISRTDAEEYARLAGEVIGILRALQRSRDEGT